MVKLIYHLSKLLSAPFYVLSLVLHVLSFVFDLLADEIYYATTYKIKWMLKKSSQK